MVPLAGMDTANMVSANDPSNLFDARGDPIQEHYCQGGIPQGEGAPPRNDRAFSIKETESIQGKWPLWTGF